MKLVKCRKCGTGIMMDSTLMENMYLEMTECIQKAKKTEGSIHDSFIQEAAQISSMITTLQYVVSEVDERRTGYQCELELLLDYIKKYNLINEETLEELKETAARKSNALILEAENRIKHIYGSYVSHMSNQTKPDPTMKAAIKKLVKGDDANEYETNLS